MTTPTPDFDALAEKATIAVGKELTRQLVTGYVSPTEHNYDAAAMAGAALAAISLPALLVSLTEVRAERDALREEKHGAYAERDRLVAVLSKLFPSHLARHPEEDTTWDDEWRNIVCIHTPVDQATWHIRESELPWFSHLSVEPDHWDGHSTEEKYERLASIAAPKLGIEDGYPFGYIGPDDYIGQKIIEVWNRAATTDPTGGPDA